MSGRMRGGSGGRSSRGTSGSAGIGRGGSGGQYPTARGGSESSVRAGRSDGRGGRGDNSRGGRGSARGGAGSSYNDLSNIDKVLTNILPATLTPSFRFFYYTIDSKDSNGQNIESLGRRHRVFNEGLWKGLLKDMSDKEKEDLQRVVYFLGTSFMSSRPIPGLEQSKLPFTLAEGDTTEGDVMICIGVQQYTAPVELQLPAPTAKSTTSSAAGTTAHVQDPNNQGSKPLLLDPTRCGECTRTFTSVEGALTHCKNTGHMPSYVGQEDENVAIPAPINLFLSFVNLGLRQAMSERLLRWGNDFYDKDAPQVATDRNGKDVGLNVFQALTLSFKLLKLDSGASGGTGSTAKPPPTVTLALECDLRAKLLRTKSVFDCIYDGHLDPSKVHFSEKEIQQVKRKWIGEIVIYKNDKKCYTVVDIDFNHSASSLPVADKGYSHEKYFADKGVILQHPNAKPMLVVLGRRNQKIHLPPELVMGNELDPKIKEILPLVASFTPDVRNKAIEKIKTFLLPGKQSNSCGALLPALGIVLGQNRIQTKAVCLTFPELVAAGVQVPNDLARNWAPVLFKANFQVEPLEAVELNVVIFHHRDLDPSSVGLVYQTIRDLINKLNTHYRFKTKPFAIVQAGDNELHWGAVEKYFSIKPPDNLFVLDFSKPRLSQDTAYPVIKQMFCQHGYLSQFVNFRQFPHHLVSDDRQERRSNIILQGVSRQILQKAGVRLWWVSIPKTLPLPVVFVGVDVFHAPVVYNTKTKSKGRKKSVAAIVVEVIRKYSNAPTRMEMYSKTFRRDAGVEYELGNELKNTMIEALREMKVEPASVIVWRDGMPDSAFLHAANEIHGIEEGIRKPVIPGVELPKDNLKIPLAYIVCQKRISTKLLTVDGKNAAPCGTMVTGLQGMEFSTFYLNGTSPPFSTPKPVRFICMRRDGPLNRVPLAQLTWSQCHSYPNWTGPIKVPSVCQKAHKLAELAGNFVEESEINDKSFKNRDHFL